MSPSIKEENTIEREWGQYKFEVANAQCKINKVIINSNKGFKEVSKVSKKSQTSTIHMRLYGRDSNNRDSDSLDNSSKAVFLA
ncbi:MAG: hypothetical protein COA39_011215 [Sulfurimonas sp.]|nr:hypothetical protein [Sulfurimonas sp.]